VVDLHEDQAARAIDTLVGIGLRPRIPVNPRDFADRSVRETWIRDRGMQVFSMIDPSNPMRVVDLFVTHPVPFEDLWSRSSLFELHDTTVRVASIPDLIRRRRAKMTKPAKPSDRWDATWEGTRKQQLESTLAATPAQRLAWLEEALEIAHLAGALEPKPTRG
jgi:hypothetical protein